MQINFTGIKNIGYYKTEFNHAAFGVLHDNDEAMERIRQMDGPSFEFEEGYLLNLELTDDFNGKHLTGFKDALRKSGLSFHEFRNPVNRNFLNIFISHEIYSENNRQYVDDEFLINNKNLELNDKTLPIFSFLAKIINEVAQKPIKNFKTNKDYFESDDARNGFALGDDVSKLWGEDYYQEMETHHTPERVKQGANDMKNFLNDVMMKYFSL